MASEITSLNQKHIEQTNEKNAMSKKDCAKTNPCIDNTPPVVSVKREKHVKSGQGDGETKWKGCA